MRSREKIAYIKGLLAAGKPRDDFDSEIFKAIVEALDSLADEVEEGHGQIEDLNDDVSDVIDFCEQLSDTFELMESSDSDNYEDEIYPEDDDLQDRNYESILCPFCSTMFYYQPDWDDEELLQCPNCKKSFKASEVNLEEEE